MDKNNTKCFSQKEPVSKSDFQVLGETESNINIMAIWQLLVNKKQIILASVLMASMISILYVMFVSPVYKATVEIVPPTNHNLYKISDLSKTEKIDLENAYALFNKNLRSHSMMHEFFNKNNVAEVIRTNDNVDGTIDISVTSFISRVSVKNNIRNQNILYLSLELPDPKLAASLANEYVEMVDAATVNQIIDRSLESMTFVLDHKRKAAKQYRENWIAKLEEAATIARVAGIDSNVTRALITQNNISSPDYSIQGRVESIERHPLYYRGARLLEAEINALRLRANDDKFVNMLQELSLSIEKLQSIKSNHEVLSSIRTSSISKAAVPAKKPIYPKTKLIVLLSSMIGLVIGIILVLLTNIIRPIHEISKENNR